MITALVRDRAGECAPDSDGGHGTVQLTAEVNPQMAERELKKKPAPQRRSDEVEATPAATEAGEKIKAELDELLDEIDDVLETNADDFVKAYIQKGGQ